MLILVVLLPKELLAKEGILTMAMRSYPPWRILNKEDVSQSTGLDVEIIGEIAKRMNLSLEFKDCAANIRCLKELEYGNIDVYTSTLKKTDREIYMYYMEPPYKPSTPKAFYVRTGKGKFLRKYEDLTNFKKAGVARGSKYFPRFDDDTTIEKYPVTSYLQALEMLSRDRVDVVPGTELTMDYLIGVNGITGVEKAYYFHEKNTPGYITVSKKSPLAKRIDEFKKVYSQLIDEGVIERIKKKGEGKWYLPRTP